MVAEQAAGQEPIQQAQEAKAHKLHSAQEQAVEEAVAAMLQTVLVEQAELAAQAVVVEAAEAKARPPTTAAQEESAELAPS